MNSKKIIIAGGNGHLGKAIANHLRAPGAIFGREELDVTDYDSVVKVINGYAPSIIINCAAIMSVQSEVHHGLARDVNINGVKNLAKATREAGVRLVHISTDYVFNGYDGNYSEDDAPDPINYYGFSKAVGEVAALSGGSPLVLRAPFRYGGPWPHKKAFCDQYTSCRWIHEVALDIVLAANDASIQGILHVGGERRCIWNMAMEVSPDVDSCTRRDFSGLNIPRDVSLNSSKWHGIKRNLL